MLRFLGLIDRVPRSVRFGGVGGGCAVLQLGLLAGLVRLGVNHHAANALAIITSTQIHFFFSCLITWRDRLGSAFERRLVVRRLAAHNTMALLSLAINLGVFALLSPLMHYLIASAIGIVVAACVNYRLSGRITFAARPGPLPGEA